MVVPFSKRHIEGPGWARDIPRNVNELFTNWYTYGTKEYAGIKSSGDKYLDEDERLELEEYKNSANYIKTEEELEESGESVLTKKEKKKSFWTCAQHLPVCWGMDMLMPQQVLSPLD